MYSNFYSNEKSPFQAESRSFSPSIGFSKLFLHGAGILGHGVTGETESRIEADKAMLNCRTRHLLKKKIRA
jgi:hypothetical protein